MKTWIDDYVELLRNRAAEFEAHGDAKLAKTCELHAREILERRALWDDVELSNVEAAKESGFTQQALGAMRRSGKWSGKRGDLPRRARGHTAVLELATSGGSGSLSIAERVQTGQTVASRRRRKTS